MARLSWSIANDGLIPRTLSEFEGDRLVLDNLLVQFLEGSSVDRLDESPREVGSHVVATNIADC